MMTALHMVELRPRAPALMRFLRDQGLDMGRDDEDLSYGIHAWMAAAFGELAPKPWRLLSDRRRPMRVLGYAQASADGLRQRLVEFAEPGAFTVLSDPEADIASKPMPQWSPGRRLAFEILVCPVGRKADSGVEKDLFLIHVDAAGDGRVDRETVYCEWAKERLERDEACAVNTINLTGFRLVNQVRRAQAAGGSRKVGRLIRPQALMNGELTVGDPEAFGNLVARGVGRHRAFGYGMLLLRPPA